MALRELAEDVVACRRCPRLIAYVGEVARSKRRAYRDWEYWGRPVPSFGDPLARLLIVGLAPAAHGANRTGRMFTGDSSGDWLYRALHKAGFANQPTSTHRDDGLELRDAYITASCHCAPPGNKPAREEIEACSSFLARELEVMQTVRVIVCLGQIAFDNVLRLMKQRGYGWPVDVSEEPAAAGASRPHSLATAATAPSPTPNGAGPTSDGSRAGAAGSRRPQKPRFRHGGEYRWPAAGGGDRQPPILLASYHPSRQNTNTGVLTEAMFDAVFRRARQLLAEDGPRDSSGP